MIRELRTLKRPFIEMRWEDGGALAGLLRVSLEGEVYLLSYSQNGTEGEEEREREQSCNEMCHR